MKKVIKFVVSVAIEAENDKQMANCIDRVIKDGLHFSLRGCGANGFFSIDAGKTRLYEKQRKNKLK